MENQKPIIIAMKGHPGTGKSTLAQALAKSLKCPLIDKDQFRDCTKPVQNTLLKSTSPTVTNALLNDLSYDATWNVASAQLGLGLSVVIDSPLSNRTRFDRLSELSSRFGAPVLVVECWAKDEPEWRRRVENRSRAGGAGSSWHKPATWNEIEGLLERYEGCWDYEFGDVKRIVVDTTAPVEFEDLVSNVLEFVHSCQS